MSWQRVLDNISELNHNMEQLLPVIERLNRPPEQVLLDDVELRKLLKVSKRTTAYLREKGLITYSKLGGKIYYLYSDVLEMISRHQIRCIRSKIAS
jgi:hypothetical protein